MAESNLNRIVVWSVDPFAGSTKLQKEAGLAIRMLLDKQNIQIQPVYSVANPLPYLPKQFTGEVFETVQERARTEFNRLCTGLKLKSLLPLIVVKSEGKSVEDQVSAVLKYAGNIGAQLIAVSTRAKTGPSRWFFGSFAETLSLRSTIPLLTVNPSWKMQRKFKTILFPTDFSEESYSAFLRVIDLAKEMGNRIHIYHKFNPLLAFNWDFPITSAQVHVDWAREELVSLETKAKKWKMEANDFDVQCTWEVEAKNNDTVVDAILKKSKKMPYMIAITAKSGPIETSLLGSITRQIIRGSTVPVMVIHPEYFNVFSDKEENERPGLKVMKAGKAVEQKRDELLNRPTG